MFSSPCLQPSPVSTPSSSRMNTLPAPKVAQPYGVIPPRRRKAPVRSTTPAQSSSTQSLPPSEKNNTIHTSAGSSPSHDHLLKAFQSFMLTESTSGRSGLWDSMKQHYLAATRIMPWGSGSSSKDGSTTDSSSSCSNFAPPTALTAVSNRSPTIVTLDATPMDDTLLSVPDIDSLPTRSKEELPIMGPYPVAVAAMDRFKVMRDAIPLKTFTYCETVVVERGVARHASEQEQAGSFLAAKRSTSKASSQLTPPSRRSSKSSTTPSITTAVERKNQLPPPLPRHLAIRETRSNSDYLRMMACEMTMIRSLKLVSPLKPRGYLPRRKELFCHGKNTSTPLIIRDDAYCFVPVTGATIRAVSITGLTDGVVGERRRGTEGTR
ncbi:hypothetical protein B0O80DRAFT_246567 [Mortierella sp. GBAus27b]|nr:hypothetical protein B0O80DRAFT_246567 [Mortierella sp. GBAus27b]